MTDNSDLSEKGNNSGGGAASSSDLFLAALQTMLLHDPKLLSVREYGVLDTCSSIVRGVVEEAGAWKRLFEHAAECGKTCAHESCFPRQREEHRMCVWNSERGFLDCFSKPDERVIASTGYKGAARCLLSRTCKCCGEMASSANPVAMARICRTCSEKEEGLFLISKSKAKEAFLLSEKDCTALRSASVPFSLIGKTGGDLKTSVVLLMADVMEASYAKHGGEDGLAAEFEKRKAKATSRYTASQSTDKPQKKRPKIESLSDRPAQNLASLQFFCGASSLPIPTIFHPTYLSSMHQPSEWHFTHPTKCTTCGIMGNINDILMHERLEHKVCSPYFPGDDVMPEPCAPFEGVSLSILAEINPTQELVQLFATADIEHVSSEKSRDAPLQVEREFSLFAFGECKVAVDCLNPHTMTPFITHSIKIYFQRGHNTLPNELVFLSRGEGCQEPNDRAFKRLVSALGLVDTKPTQLLAALITRAMPVNDFLRVFLYDKPRKETAPVIHEVWTLLKEVYVESDNEYWGEY